MGLKDRLEQNRREQEWATTWKPDRGEMLVGTFEKMDEGESDYGTHRIAHLRDEDGELWAVWLFHTVLQNQWGEADPTPGDRVGILYLGKRDGSDFDYHAYDVEVERGESAPKDSEKCEAGAQKCEADGTFASDEQTEDRPEPTMDDPNAELPY